MDEHLTRFTLERMRGADLTAEQESAVQGHLASCPACRRLEAELEADRAAFAAEVPYAAFRIEHERRLAARRPRRWALWVPAFAAAGAAAALLLAVLPASEPTERIKGNGVALSFAVVENGVGRPGLSGEAVPAGATLQLTYDAGSHSHLAVFGLDEKGGVSQYFPNGTTTMAPNPAGSSGPLPFSLTLDPFTGSERFFAVFGRGPTDLSPMLGAIRRLGGTDLASGPPLKLGGGLAQASFWVRQR